MPEHALSDPRVADVGAFLKQRGGRWPGNLTARYGWEVDEWRRDLFIEILCKFCDDDAKVRKALCFAAVYGVLCARTIPRQVPRRTEQ